MLTKIMGKFTPKSLAKIKLINVWCQVISSPKTSLKYSSSYKYDSSSFQLQFLPYNVGVKSLRLYVIYSVKHHLSLDLLYLLQIDSIFKSDTPPMIID